MVDITNYLWDPNAKLQRLNQLLTSVFKYNNEYDIWNENEVVASATEEW